MTQTVEIDAKALEAAIRECARITAPEVSDEEFEADRASGSARYTKTVDEMTLVLRAYLSALEPAPADGWRGMESAPKDGTVILAYMMDGEVDFFHWQSHRPVGWCNSWGEVPADGSNDSPQRWLPHPTRGMTASRPSAPVGSNE